MTSSATGPTKRPRSRKSVGYLPSPEEHVASLDKENLGDMTTALDLRLTSSKIDALSKRSRSKSLGPGGLDALREDAGNRRNAATVGVPKSILKPSIPISPLKDIPVRKIAVAGKKEKSQIQSPRKGGTSPSNATEILKSNLDEEIISLSLKTAEKSPAKKPETTSDILDALQSIEPKELDVLQEEAKQARAEAMKQRDLRRKSMANRRVSFAPEATLHTWDMIEEMQDSTTSSASTSTMRRASAVSEASTMMSPNSRQTLRTLEVYTDDPPSTPISQAEGDVVPESPASQRNLRQKKRGRRTSSVPPLNFNNPDDDFSSPSDSLSFSESNDSPTERKSPATVVPPGRFVNLSPTRSPDRGDLEDNMNSSIGEPDDVPMELADDEITAAFKPWSQNLFDGKNPSIKLISSQQQDNSNPFSPAFKNATKPLSGLYDVSSMQDDGEMSMDITRAIGFISTKGQMQSESKSGMGPSPTPRRSVRNRQRFSMESTSMEDASMDLTTAIGAIQSKGNGYMDVSVIDTNEDLSMEFTSVFTKINSPKAEQTKQKPGDQSLKLDTATEHAFKQIHSANTKPFQDIECDLDLTTASDMNNYTVVQNLTTQEDVDDIDMDITRAVGTILSTKSRLSRSTLENEDIISGGVALESAPRSHVSAQPNPSILASPSQDAVTGNEQARRSSVGIVVDSRATTNRKGPKTPPRYMNPSITRPTTPGKTPPLQDVVTRTLSPTKLFQTELKEEIDQQTSLLPLFHADSRNLISQALVSPRIGFQRRFSGVGIDREGLGSPRVATLLDRRAPISENAATFSPSLSGVKEVRFDDPKIISQELAIAHEQEERRESRQYVLEQEVNAGEDEKNITATLKEAIVNMTPKRKRLGGRKSLAVGAAKGLLGIRPTELDESDEDRTPRGVRSGHASPMKKIKLSGQHAAANILGQLNKNKQSVVNIVPSTPSTRSPLKIYNMTTPKSQGRFKDAETFPDAQVQLPAIGHQYVDDVAAIKQAEAREKVHLRDFLNLTSIRFIELNTTKRRHTVAPQNDQDTLIVGLDFNGNILNAQRSFEESVVAGACTVPLLELFQHSCRELKKYIAEGRDVIHEIEAETYNDNPVLFQEYISALPADRAMMDQQFKNMKTHARLLSKGMWYEWRMKLLEGLKEGLRGNAGELQADAEVLLQQERVIELALPTVLEERDVLKSNCTALQKRAEEVANSDHEALKGAQDELLALEHEFMVKRQLTEDYERGFHALDSAVQQAQQTKVECWQSIREAQKLSEDCRGWSIVDVKNLRASVDALEATYGWTVTSAASNSLTLVYRRELEVYFSVSSFLPAAASSTNRVENSPISLVYIGDTDDHHPKPLTTEKRFFLQFMRAHVQCLSQHHTNVKDLLRFVQQGWDKASEISSQVSKLDVDYITNCSILSDERLAVNSTMLLSSLKTKIQVVFEVFIIGKGEELEMGVVVKAGLVYGEKYNEDKMADHLMSKVARGPTDGRCDWVNAVRDLKKKLISQGKKH